MPSPRQRRIAKQVAAAREAKAAERLAKDQRAKATATAQARQAAKPVKAANWHESVGEDSGKSELLFTFTSSADGAHNMPAPQQGGEVAVIGRSNVGKSSLLNALAGRTQGKNELAKTSGRPGKTQLLNIFAYRYGGQLVDLPGYGYAKISKAERVRWQARMEHYLATRDLSMVLALIDAQTGPQGLDLATMEWMQYHGVRYTIVATKIDKVKPSQLAKTQASIAQQVQRDASEIFWVSAHDGTDIPKLRKYVHKQLVK